MRTFPAFAAAVPIDVPDAYVVAWKSRLGATLCACYEHSCAAMQPACIVFTGNCLWKHSHVLYLSNLVSAVRLAEAALEQWQQYYPYWTHMQTNLSDTAGLPLVHRECGRLLKHLCQISAWAHHIQQRRSTCRVCRSKWPRCMCTIRIHPHNWTTPCDISASGRVAARPSDVPFTPAGRSDVWPSIIRIEQIKATVYRDFLLTSRTHHDQRLHNFCRLAAAKCGFPNRASTGILYMWAAPWCKHLYDLYVGQTGTYGWKRMRTHIDALNAGSDTGKPYDQMRKTHISRFVFLPVCDFSVVAPYHADRLFLEAQAISLLRPSLNTQGLPMGKAGPKHGAFGTVLIPRRQAQRPVMSLRQVPEQAPTLQHRQFPLALPRSPAAAQSWCRRMQVVVAVARRPLWQRGRCNNQALCTLIANWSPRQSLKILSLPCAA